ncbi:hypothetical protein L9F63_013247, partial [Diploptera punctata]
IRNLVELGLSSSGEPEGNDNEGFSQDWFEDDYDLTNTRREAELLRLQQLQIEQEIQELEQAQEQVPYFYYREIPNKPPPPYTPPNQTTGNTVTQQPKRCCFTPSTSEEITCIVMEATNHLYNILITDGNITHSEPPPQFNQDTCSSAATVTEQSSVRIYKKMIFDLTKDIVKEFYGLNGNNPCGPWDWPAISCKKTKQPLCSKEIMQEKVLKKVLDLLGQSRKVNSEKVVICMNRKHRDIVNEILMKETHEEESSWTNYEEEEVLVKNEITLGVLDSLLDETVQILLGIRKSKAENSYEMKMMT